MTVRQLLKELDRRDVEAPLQIKFSAPSAVIATNLKGIKFDQLSGELLTVQKGTFRRTHLNNCYVRHCAFDGLEVRGIVAAECSIERLELHHSPDLLIVDSDIIDCQFGTVRCNHAVVTDSTFTNVTIRNAVVARGQFRRCIFNNCRFTGCFQTCNFIECRFPGTDMRGVKFSDCAFAADQLPLLAEDPTCFPCDFRSIAAIEGHLVGKVSSDGLKEFHKIAPALGKADGVVMLSRELFAAFSDADANAIVACVYELRQRRFQPTSQPSR